MGKDKRYGGGKRRFKGKKGMKAKYLARRTQARSKFNKFDTACRLVVKNLSFKTTEENLKQHFEPYGKVLEVKLLKKNNGDILGTGFVQFTDIEQAKHALNSRNDQPFLGRSIQIEWANIKDESSQNKNIESNDDIEIKSEPESDLNEAEKPTTSEAKGRDNQKVLRKARIIVRNISFKATEESLKEHFKSYGEVLESVVLKKPNGELVGCGFVQFNNVKSAANAILETNSKQFLGRPIFVDWAVAKNKYMSYVTQKKDEERYLQNEVKSEPESDDDDEKPEPKPEIDDTGVKQESCDESDDSDESNEDGSEKESDSDESDEDMDINEDADEDKRVPANDAEDGRTIFFKNVSFSVTNDDLREFATQFGEINYALVCVDKLTEHSKGTAFVRFVNKEDADMCFSADPEKLYLQGQQLQPLSAVFREKSKGKSTGKKEAKDSRNLYLIKEGLILANSKSAVGVSATDMTKRLSLEQRKSDMLRNLNRFISRYRLTIHNIPEHYSDEDLRKLCLETTNVKSYALKECRIMRHMKGPFDAAGKPMSKGFGFVMFTKHEFALTCLRRMNNNPNVFDKNNRPIVAFSIEDKSVINARKKRLIKSKLKNPIYINKMEKLGVKPGIKSNTNFKSKTKNAHDNSSLKGKNKKNEQKPQNPVEMDGDFVGEAGKPGVVSKMRSRYKLKMQASMHKENLKLEKKQQKSMKGSKKMLSTKMRIKQPKQKMNGGQRNKMKKMAEQKVEKNFSDLVNKYKSKLVDASKEHKVKSKWYEQS